MQMLVTYAASEKWGSQSRDNEPQHPLVLWWLMEFGPVLTLLAGYVALWDSLFFPSRVSELALEGHCWAYSSDRAYQISSGLLLALFCFAIAGVNAVSLWVSGPARFIALLQSGPSFIQASEDIYRSFRRYRE